MRFKTWLEQTISDALAKMDSKPIKNSLRTFLSQHLNGRDLDVAVNLFAYIYLSEGSDASDIQKDWDQFKDLLTAYLSVKRNLFISPITRQQLEDLNIKYHRELKLNKNLRKGPVGLPIINVEEKLKNIIEEGINLPRNFSPNLWAGWKWTSLGCGYSKEEGAAGGHCGNVAGIAGDNIISLRDPSGNVLLTFVVNTKTGTLKEAKGVNNQKPTPEFHPPIVALITSDYVRNYKTSSYVQEDQGIADFSPEDLKYDENLYNLVQSHLNKESHINPENYMPLNWVEQWDDQKINSLDDNQKIDLLDNILKTLSNHKPLTGTEENFTLNFKLSSLIRSVFQKIPKVKKVLEILEIIEDLYENNKITTNDELKQFRPDVHKHFTGKISVADWQKSDGIKFRKKDQIDIDDDLINFMVQHAKKLSMSPRDRGEFINVLHLLGQRDEIEMQGEDIFETKKKHNIFKKEIDESVAILIRDSLFQNKKLSDEVCYSIADSINLDHQGLFKELGVYRIWIGFEEIKQKTARIFLSFKFPKLNKQEFLKYYKENKHEFIKSGYSRKRDSGYVDVDPWRRRYGLETKQSSPSDLYSCVSDLFRRQFIKEIQKRSNLFSDEVHVGNVEYSTVFDVVLREDTKKVLNNYLNEKNIVTDRMKIIMKKVSENVQKINQQQHKNLDKFIKNNMEEIIRCVKKMQMNKNKKSQDRRHHKSGFQEWIDKNKIRL